MINTPVSRRIKANCVFMAIVEISELSSSLPQDGPHAMPYVAETSDQKLPKRWMLDAMPDNDQYSSWEDQGNTVFVWPSSKARSSARTYCEVDPRPCPVWLKPVTESSKKDGCYVECQWCFTRGRTKQG